MSGQGQENVVEGGAAHGEAGHQVPVGVGDLEQRADLGRAAVGRHADGQGVLVQVHGPVAAAPGDLRPGRRADAGQVEALRADPTYAAAFYNRGIAWRRKGDLDRAIADYDQAIKLNPTATAYNNQRQVFPAVLVANTLGFTPAELLQAEEAARAAVDALAEHAAGSGLEVHWGRKVMEVRPPVRIDKGRGVTALVQSSPVTVAMYAGDDVTDLDGFKALRELAESSPSIVTPLNSVIGYEEAAAVAKQALKERKTIRQTVIDRGLIGDKLSLEELDRRLDVLAMAKVTHGALAQSSAS